MPQLIRETVDVACAFCNALVSISGLNKQAPRRKQVIGNVKCPHCDSRFEIDLSTRRIAKGKRWKEREAAAERERKVKVAAAELENNRIALELLAQPGCDCAKHAPNETTAKYYDMRRDGLVHGGWGRDRIPLPPRHRIQCPCHDAAPEVSP